MASIRAKRTSAPALTIPTPGAAVKARIVGAGLKLSSLAAEAGIAPSTLSQYLGGAIARLDTQIAIWRAYRRLARRRVTLSAFWGELLSKEAA